MNRAEAIVITDHLLAYYPFSKAQEEDLSEDLYQHYKGYDREAIVYLINLYLQENRPYFPKYEELEEIRIRSINEAELILKDPRNPYYQKVSSGAGARRQAKISKALWILKALDNKNVKQLN